MTDNILGAELHDPDVLDLVQNASAGCQSRFTGCQVDLGNVAANAHACVAAEAGHDPAALVERPGAPRVRLQRAVVVFQGEVVATQAAVNVVADDLTATGQKLSQLDTRVTEMDAAVHGELEQLQQKLVTITDHVDSINGRVTNLRPHRTFGNGSVINGPEWVAAQPAERYTVRVATVTTKQDLYKTAERYSHYLKQDLAYVAQKNGYALLLGSYDSVQAARIGMASLPYYVGFERPSVLSFKSLAN